MGAVGAGKVVAVADGPAYAELKPSPGGGVGVAGPLGPGVIDDIADWGFGFRGSDPRSHPARVQYNYVRSPISNLSR